MLTLTLENLRAFAGRHEIPVSPLTVFVGENSAGKSTAMAALSIVCDRTGFPFFPNFNRAPYQLGNYDTIATYKGGKYGRAKHFLVGYRDSSPKRGSARTAEATYEGRDGQAELKKFVVESESGRITLSMDHTDSDTLKGRLTVASNEIEDVQPFSIARGTLDRRYFSLLDLVMIGAESFALKDRQRYMKLFNAAQSIAWRSAPLESESVAPIRTKPERTYGGIAQDYAPSGEQVPFVLERLDRYADAKSAVVVKEALERFGEDAGLFGSVTVRKLGSKAGEPFQIMVKIGGRNRNLMDVGYGVSQALPIIVQGALSSKENLLLIQQPEVHLHPRAQAALGTFFVELSTRTKRRIVVESHSDFIIDRIRQEIAAKRIATTDVGIVFFERQKLETKAHTIGLDALGNIVNAPDSYRQFFLEEELRLLTRGSSDVSDR